MMPGMDGIETTKIIRNGIGAEYAKTVPIIALTASAISGSKEMFLANGFNSYISKPIDIMKLDAMLNKWVRDKQSEETLAGAERDRGNMAGYNRDPQRRTFGEFQAEGSGLSCGISRYENEAANLNDIMDRWTSGEARAEDCGALKIEGLDTGLGLKRIGGSMKDYLDVLEIYCRDVESALPVLEDISAENIENFVIRVHALKAASANVGAAALSNEAAVLEEAGKKRELRTIREKAGIFRERLTGLIFGIRRAVSPVNGTDKSGEKTESMPVAEDLLSLREAIGSKNIGAIDTALDKLSVTHSSDSARNLLSSISNHVLLADFDEAEDIVNNMIEEMGL
jgi:HPt (histidine-containing phosphotransfer) domain-containing protein